MRSIGSLVTPKRLIGEATVTASPSSVTIDRGSTNNNLYEAIELAMYVGAGGITFTSTNYIALKLEDSDDNSTFTAVTSSSSVLQYTTNANITFSQSPDSNGFVRLIASAKASADTDPFSVGYVGGKRYLRVTIVFGGTHSTGTNVGLWAVLGLPQSLPAA